MLPWHHAHGSERMLLNAMPFGKEALLLSRVYKSIPLYIILLL